MMDMITLYADYTILGLLALMSLLLGCRVIERYFFYWSLELSDYSDVHSVSLDLRRGLALIHAIGAIAPYVGLLGTSISVAIALYTAGQVDGNIDFKSLILALAMALKAFFVSLIVAILAVWFDKTLNAKAENQLLSWKIFRKHRKKACTKKLTGDEDEDRPRDPIII